MRQPLLQMDFRLVVGAIIVLAGAVIAIWLAGRRLRRDLGAARTGELGLPSGVNAPTGIAKELQARGLVTPAQLATMTETERQLLFSTMAGAITREADGTGAPRPSGARPVIRPEDLPTIFCPLCSYRIEQFGSTPPITGQCETCGAKVIVRRDAQRILLTVMEREETGLRRPDARNTR